MAITLLGAEITRKTTFFKKTLTHNQNLAPLFIKY